MNLLFFVSGAFFAAAGVALGAFGAHALKHKLATDMLAVFEVGVRYQMYHALGLLALSLAMGYLSNGFMHWAGVLMIGGIVLFSGSLYLLSLTGIKSFGAVTPFGGGLFIAAWILLILGALKS